MMFNPEFSLSQANSFLSTIKMSAAYATVGKMGKWNSADALGPIYAASDRQRKEDETDAIVAKRILPQHTSLVVRRVNWSAGKKFSQWDDKDPDILTRDFYCITSLGNVYKCIDNSGGAQSSVEPTGTNAARFETADGYVWKYLYTVTPDQAELFLTPQWMPIKEVNASYAGTETQFASQVAAIPGTVDRVEIVSGGQLYSESAVIEIHGDGSGATADIQVHPITGAIVSAVITNAGSNYTYAYAIVTDPAPGMGSGGLVEVVVSPKIGHGKRPALELGARNVLVSFVLDGEEAGNIKGPIEFRKIVVFDALKDLGGTPLNGPVYDLTTAVECDDLNGTFILGEKVSLGGGTGVITHIDGNVIRVSSVVGGIGATIVGESSGASANVLGTASSPVAEFGDPLFISYFEKREKGLSQTTGFLCNFKF